MRIVLFGATGYTGRAIMGEAVRRGDEVTAVARNVGSVVHGRQVQVVQGSIQDRGLVTRVMDEARGGVLVSAVPARPDADGRSLLDAVPHLTRAAWDNEARLGVVGGAGSLRLHEGGDLVATELEAAVPPEALTEIETHQQVLLALEETKTDVDWFYLSPPIEFGAEFPGETLAEYRLGADVAVRDAEGRSTISAADYALAFMDEVDSPRHHRQQFTVGH